MRCRCPIAAWQLKLANKEILSCIGSRSRSRLLVALIKAKTKGKHWAAAARNGHFKFPEPSLVSRMPCHLPIDHNYVAAAAPYSSASEWPPPYSASWKIHIISTADNSVKECKKPAETAARDGSSIGESCWGIDSVFMWQTKAAAAPPGGWGEKNEIK